MSKNLSREELEQDLLVEYSSRLLHFYQQNKSKVIGGGTAFFVLVASVIGFTFYSSQQSDRAEQLMVQAENLYRAGSFEQALYGDEETFTVGFEQIANNYGSTDAGNLAHYYAASSRAEMGEFEEALAAIEKYKSPKGVMGVAPRALHAYILAETGNYEMSGKKYEEAANLVENESTTPMYLISAAKAYMKAGNNSKAADLLDTVIKQYRNSQYATAAENMKSRIG